MIFLCQIFTLCIVKYTYYMKYTNKFSLVGVC